MSQFGSCNQALSSIARFYALPLELNDFSKPPQNTQISVPLPPLRTFLPSSLYSLHTNIIQNNRKTIQDRKPITTFKISTSMFFTIDKIYHNHHFISTDCNYTIPSYQISTTTPSIGRRYW